jgi:hypothetical protein
MKTAFKIFASLLAFSIYSCNSVPSEVRRDFTNCYSGGSVDYSTKLNLNGYYRMRPVDLNATPPKVYDYDGEDTVSNMSILFYPNGMLITNFGGVRVQDNFNDIVVNKNTESEQAFYRGRYWGVYSISGDTIKAQWINNPGPLAPQGGAEVLYRIIDKNTIQYITKRTIPGLITRNNDYNITELKEGMVYRGLFTPLEVIPPSEGSWLMREDWFWCDEAKFDEWKASLKQGNKI